MNLFYFPEAKHGLLDLSEEESKHCVRVLRMSVGDPIVFTNGKGWFFDGILATASPKRCQVDIIASHEEKVSRDFRIHIALSPTKSLDRVEWFVEKSTEIGIDEISFFTSDFSERKALNIDRLNRVAVAAMKQSLKSRLPVLNEMVSFRQFIHHEMKGQKFIAWIDEGVQTLLVNQVNPSTEVTVIIGPEGDFSANEVKTARSNGYIPVSLGTSRLRTETAALVSCQTIQLINQIHQK
ncbi:MAG: 16S rRNA (uracil(1498)-N(3))-methyltransferase [Bacteroidales bacterium]|nr:16S rRNA (uracil(1498)-N(3))-methyltransferase [Bacteroidales bacterium]